MGSSKDRSNQLEDEAKLLRLESQQGKAQARKSAAGTDSGVVARLSLSKPVAFCRTCLPVAPSGQDSFAEIFSMSTPGI